MKKIVLRVSFNCQKCKTSVLKAVTKLEGINSVAVDGEKEQSTVIGEVDPVMVVKQIRKSTEKSVEIISVGPPKPKSPDHDIKPLPIICCKECELVAVSYVPYAGGFCSIL